jgi:hypothetical protein
MKLKFHKNIVTVFQQILNSLCVSSIWQRNLNEKGILKSMNTLIFAALNWLNHL